MRTWLRAVALLLFLTLAAGGGAARSAETRLPEPQEARLRELTRELRCMVCQNESLAESHAPLAADLREEIREQMRAGSSDQEIIAYLVARYGDFVTYRPPFNTRTVLLWLGPCAILLLLLGALWSVYRRGRSARFSPVSEQEAHEMHKNFRRLKRQYGADDD